MTEKKSKPSQYQVMTTPQLDLCSVEPQHRISKWNDALHEHFYNYETEYPTDFNIGIFKGVIVGDLRVASIKTDPMFVERDAKHVAKDGKDAYYLLLPQGGNITLQQRGKQTTVCRGQFTFVSTAEPYSYHQKETESFHTLVIPGSLVRSRKPDADDYLGADFGSSSLQRVFVDFADSFCRNASAIDEVSFKRTHDSLLDMLALVLEKTDTSSNETAAILANRRRIVNIIESSFRNPHFRTRQIADSLDLSPRYIQHVLAASGDTVSGLLSKRRISEACCLLRRREMSRMSVGSVAFSVGYTDPAYFSRVFRRVTGKAPMEFASE